MPSFVITYDLRKRGRDYEKLYDRLRDWKAISVLESVWIISWDSESTIIRDDLKQYIDDNDALFVAKLTGQAAWAGKLLSSDQSVKNSLH